MTTFEKIEKIARSQVGYHEGRSDGHWNNDQKYSDELPGFDWSDGQAWCATFVNWCFWKAGEWDLIDAKSASCDVLGSGFKKAGRWSEYPAKGAVVFYGTPSDLSHTGFVVDYDKDYIYVVEGNTNDNGSREGDGVYLKKRARRDDYVVGYGYPKFPEGIENADPDVPEPKPAPSPAPAPAPAPVLPKVSLANLQKAARIASWSHGIANGEVRGDVKIILAALKAEGVKNWRQWQIKRGLTGAAANGIPDAPSLKALGKKRGFTVTK